MVDIDISAPNLAEFQEAIMQAVATINVDNPLALGILCNGSVPAGTATTASDVDLCVCCDAPVSRFIRKAYAGKVVDLHFEDGRWLRTVRPPYDVTAMFMLANVHVLWERDGLLSSHVAAATEQFAQPAPQLSEWEEFLIRIDCSVRLARLREAEGDANFAVLLGGLMERAIEATLRMNRRWYLDTGHGLRDLRLLLPDAAGMLSRVAEADDPKGIARRMAEYLTVLFGRPMPETEWDSGPATHEQPRSGTRNGRPQTDTLGART